MESTVTRQTPELIAQAKARPHEFKPLSDLDDRESLRFHVVAIQFYRRNLRMEGIDLVEVIRHAIARALLFYYPFAGRLREWGPHKLVVECIGEGVAFTGANANMSLEQFGHVLCPSFLNLEDLVCPVDPASRGLVHSPLFHIQVTRLKCEGFIFSIRMNHTICDVPGLVQFLSAVAELVRGGAGAPSVPPVWQRHLLTAPSPPRTWRHHTAAPDTNPIKQVERSFLLAAGDISALRHSLPPHARGCTKFELVVVCVWQSRTIALSPNPNEEIRLSLFVNMRKRVDPPLPEGYYGNTTVWPEAVTTAEELSGSPLDYAVGLVRKIKSDATEEHMRSVVDMDLTAGGGPEVADPRRYVVADHTHIGLREVDYGWGAAAYGGSATVGIETAPGLQSFVTSFEKRSGEGGLAVSICLPPRAMEVFGEELQKIIVAESKASNFTPSAL